MCQEPGVEKKIKTATTTAELKREQKKTVNTWSWTLSDSIQFNSRVSIHYVQPLLIVLGNTICFFFLHSTNFFVKYNETRFIKRLPAFGLTIYSIIQSLHTYIKHRAFNNYVLCISHITYWVSLRNLRKKKKDWKLNSILNSNTLYNRILWNVFQWAFNSNSIVRSVFITSNLNMNFIRIEEVWNVLNVHFLWIQFDWPLWISNNIYWTDTGWILNA